jgi:DNA-binding SARP family transcriptional activator
MEFRILGPLEALEEGRVVTLGGGKQRALLAVLLLHANETLTTDRLIDELWGENPPATAAKTIQVRIARLRRALAGNGSAGVVVTSGHGYQLKLDPERLDARRFERLVAEDAASWPRAAPRAPPRRWSGRCRFGAPRGPRLRAVRAARERPPR